MFLQSSTHSSWKSIILTALIEVNKDYRRYRKVIGETFQQTTTEIAKSNTTIIHSRWEVGDSNPLLDVQYEY